MKKTPFPSLSTTQHLAILLQKSSMRVALLISSVVVILCLFVPLFGTIEQNTLYKFSAPSWQAWFGTDILGRDIALQVFYGGRTSLLIGLSVMLISTVIGIVLGMIAGWFTRLDAWLFRLTDALMAIPSILFAIAFLQVMEPNLMSVVLTLTLVETPRFIRIVRASVLAVRNSAYIDAAILLGAPTYQLFYRHLLPPALGPILVQMSFTFASAMLLEALLGFLGLGLSPEIPSWGNMIAQGQPYFSIYPWLIIFPGIFLSSMVIATHLIGDTLRDYWDPKHWTQPTRKMP